jgi:serine/threonine-protein kinase
MSLSTGQVLNNRYRIVSLLAQGGFGAVYRAWDLNLKAPVALKENLATAPEALRQFSLEAHLLANLRHENLPFVIDHFSLPGQGGGPTSACLVMEYVEGQDLQSMLDQAGGPLPEAQALTWMKQVAEAVIYLHGQTPPIIHRDIKPANIKITPKGQVMLVDFGIAKQYNPSQQTTVGARAVTLGFSPPEQYGVVNITGMTDARSDVYALGATLYALLTGQTPVESLQRRMGRSMLSPRQLNTAVSPRAEQLILRAMELQPEMRFQSVREFRDALNACASSPPVVQRQVETASPAQAPTRLASGVNAAGSPGNYQRTVLAPAPEEPVFQAPAQPRANTWIRTAVIVLIIACLLVSILAGGGIYAMIFAPDSPISRQATQTQFSRLIAQTATALALQVGGRTPTSTERVSASWTPLPETPFSPPPTVTFTPTLFPSPIPTWTPLPTPTATETPSGKWQPCSGSYASRLHVGDRAYVSYNPPLPNRVRSEPNTTSAILGALDVGEQMEIIEGPACSNNWVWWRVSSLAKSLVGWTAEGDGKDYWLVPLP